uniref:Uncharacterized protein n=1 Tax=Octopus bimaculoides TaxID=37653 RepID=A0A0L8I6H9_OCTBM
MMFIGFSRCWFYQTFDRENTGIFPVILDRLDKLRGATMLPCCSVLSSRRQQSKYLRNFVVKYFANSFKNRKTNVNVTASQNIAMTLSTIFVILPKLTQEGLSATINGRYCCSRRCSFSGSCWFSSSSRSFTFDKGKPELVSGNKGRLGFWRLKQQPNGLNIRKYRNAVSKKNGNMQDTKYNMSSVKFRRIFLTCLLGLPSFLLLLAILPIPQRLLISPSPPPLRPSLPAVLLSSLTPPSSSGPASLSPLAVTALSWLSESSSSSSSSLLLISWSPSSSSSSSSSPPPPPL